MKYKIIDFFKDTDGILPGRWHNNFDSVPMTEISINEAVSMMLSLKDKGCAFYETSYAFVFDEKIDLCHVKEYYFQKEKAGDLIAE